MSNSNEQLQHWFAKMPGKALLDGENTVLKHLLPDFNGYHLLQIHGPVKFDLLEASRISHRIHLTCHCPCDFNGCCVCANPEEGLPFAPDSLDVVLLPHVLEFSKHPKQILENIYHSLIPEGVVIIFDFHPWSLWGLAKAFKNNKKIPWSGKFYSSYRVRSWLRDIGYHIETHKTVFFRPPSSNIKWLNRLSFMEPLGQLLWPYCGGVNVIVAKKRVVSAIPIQRRLKTKKIPLAPEVAQPTVRSHRC